MIEKINTHIDNEYKFQMEQKIAEYQTLQSEINPHFLHNTLNILIALNRLGDQFHLVDSIGKKVKVATEIANAIGLKNVTFRHCRAEEEKRKFDFVVSRAVMPLGDLIKIPFYT